ncbi:hypothetical protein [Candidatus Rhabdochlamydia sp. T3358]|uniref:hypothetical protein n=1 Tax=Candidatus Rhabdochlamydia sp. T3358 TaxID=2099795 RepID=UPI0010B86384|nr:hypothetical protein [Candidatus Rhabdochlamydia sp. T3358]VHO01995.1 hypothetical protein RHT_00312 [Candidatus Rhabdochlamydia sp. T3358]
MFINFIVKLFVRFNFYLFILPTAFVFGSQPNVEQEKVIYTETVEEEQPSPQEKKLIRVRRKPPKRRGPTPRRLQVPQESTATAPNLERLSLSARDASPEGRKSTDASRKRPSPTAAQASPPKQVKVEKKPVVPPVAGLPIAYAPTPTQSNDRYKLLQGLKSNYSPLSCTNPQETLKSFRHFRLQWNIDNQPNTGMEHILRRHTYDYHDGSVKEKQSMFPRGTTDIEIKNMIKEVAENPISKTRSNAELGIKFLQIEGRAKNNIPLVVGYKKNMGLNKPLDIVQAYPLGKKYEVQVLPSPTRRRRAAGTAQRIRAATRSIVKHLNLPKLFRDYFRSQKHKPSTLGMENFLNPSPIIERGLNSINTPSQEAKTVLGPIVTRDDIKKSLRPLRLLSLAFSNAENSMDLITFTWKTITDRSFQLPFAYTKQYEFYKNNELVTQGDSTTFTHQPDESVWTEYKIAFTDSEGNREESMPLKVGANMITNLKATTADRKILLEWDPVTIENQEITYKVLRNEKILATLNTNSFEDNEVESDQDYIYRILVFVPRGHRILYSQPFIVNGESAEGIDSFALYTHLLSEEVSDLNDLSEHPEEHYTPISEKEPSSVIVQNSIITWDDESVEMLNGMIDVVANGQSLLSPRCFDNVRILWDYLLTMVAQYVKEGQAKVYFPDQPIVVSLQKKEQDTVEFQIDDQCVTIDEKQCLTAILHAAEQFFTLLNEVSIDKYTLLLEQIKTLQNQVLIQEKQQPILQAQVKRNSTNEVLLSWIPDSAQDIKNYEVLICNEPLTVLPADTREYIINIQEENLLGKHVYQIVANDQNDREYEPYSVEFEVTTSYLQVEKITPDVFELNWAFLGEEIGSIEFYNVYRDNTCIMQVSKDTTRLSDTTLLAPGTYTYKVEPLDENGSSLEIQPAVREIVVMKENYLRSYVNASNIVKLSWEFLDEDEGLQVYRISRDGNFIRYILKGQPKEFTDTLELESGEYTYTVEARDSSGNILETKQVVIKIDD